MNKNPLSQEQKFSMAPEVLFQQFDDKALLVSLNSEKVYQLNETGTFVAQLILDGNSVEEILIIVEEQYATPAGEIARDLYVLLDELLSEGLIVLQNLNHDL